ncbi:NAD(P)/FAD-dependent oxidoreductase [Pseudokineococcus sp. 5B2Z-1]|uniref:FAD-dependent oxidoreductase n=1 Tax=Pseudokineococcus sp. 5B2Z-1 TaxID=3132744 RepID=UPI0030A3D8C5
MAEGGGQVEVVVVGAGVGGLAAARGLHRDGHAVVVLEEAPALRDSGGAVTLWPGATAVLDDLDVDAERLGRRLTRMERRSPDGRPLLSLDLRAAGGAVVTVPRGRLVDALAAGATRSLVRTGARCTGLAEGSPDGDGGGRPAVLLDGGGRAEADAVVGADGARSAVRAALHGDALRPTGATTWQLPPLPTGTALDDGDACLLLVGRAGMLGLNPCGDGLVQVWWDVRRPPAVAGEERTGRGPHDGPEEPARLLRRLFGGWRAPEARAALALLDDPRARLTAYERGTYRVHRPWGRGRATLLGDAAHAVPPALAQGTNQALEDAAALARALRRPSAAADPAAALRSYERESHPRTALVSEASRREPTGRVLPEALLRAVPDRAATALLRGWLRATSDRTTGQRTTGRGTAGDRAA